MTTTKLPVSLQLWSVRDLVTADFAGTMAAIAQLGFTGVELAGLGSLSVADAESALRAAGLKVSGMHVPLEALRASIPAVAEQALRLGTSHVICPWCPPILLESAAACEGLGAELNAMGARFRSYGLAFHYHHHDFELREWNGRLGLDWLLDASEPRNVGCEIDVYWLHKAGVSPARFVAQQGRRIRLVHLKDEYEIGTGPVDFPSLFNALDTVGATEWLVVEQEQFRGPPLEAVGRGLEQLRLWGRV